ncbi:MAG TPA: molybdopterin-dependent oxidoreductase [Alphaproteobacteria bacterium]|nr:molybdopterin-dependent oxidoreductase [Alphaproteobacteria bacterium]
MPANPAPPPAAARPPAGGDLPPPDSTTAVPEPAAEPPPPAPEPTAATLPLAGPPRDRPLTKDFPQKGRMILQSTRPPVLETEMEVFDKTVITPNDRFYVEWHAGTVPTAINALFFRLTVHGNVVKPLSLSLADLKAMKKVEITAIDQAPGNSRGLFQPRVPGIQWGHGAMGNAKWTGVPLRDILTMAGIRPGTVQLRFKGLAKPVPGAPEYMKSLNLAHAMNGEVIVAFAMNGAPMPVLNGFPLRLIVPGWYGNYWIKALTDIEALSTPDDNYWMASGERVPANRNADVAPGTMGFDSAPVSRMAPRSFITNVTNGEKLMPDKPAIVRGIAMGGDNGVARVDFSSDGGLSWMPAKLGKDTGKYGFRQWEARIAKPAAGKLALMSRCTSTGGQTQSMTPNWNPGGLARNAIEMVQVTVSSPEAESDALQ